MCQVLQKNGATIDSGENSPIKTSLSHLNGMNNMNSLAKQKSSESVKLCAGFFEAKKLFDKLGLWFIFLLKNLRELENHQLYCSQNRS